MAQGALALAPTFHSIHLAFTRFWKGWLCKTHWLAHLTQTEYFSLSGFHVPPGQCQEDDSQG